ncbi:MAG: Tex family protein [Spirochaetota bacterium]
MSVNKNIQIVSKELNIKDEQVEAVAALLSEDSTIPFIARYRKEATGGLDEVQIAAIRDRLEQLDELDKRREAILKSMKEMDKLTPELEKEIIAAETLAKLEDIYLPFKPKRKTRGSVAKEKGLEPLAELIFSQKKIDLEKTATEYINTELGVNTSEDALQGARDIIAEWINENSLAREHVRNLFAKSSSMSSKIIKGKEKEGGKYRDYFDWSESVVNAPSHRILALLRGAEEGFLSVHFLPEEDEAVAILDREFIKADNSSSEQIKLTVKDSYKRLMGPSMETEMRSILKKRADVEAIKVFSDNIRELLLASPLGQKSVLALDPGLRTGCKLVCLSRQGTLLHNEAIYPLEPHNKKTESAKIIKELCEKYKIEAISIGNGTGGREALAFCNELGLENIIITMVNESGASVYSASETARKEFPDYDVTVRGAVSIGRRLMDPLAELVKIDPKAIGVGQYQHDVDQKDLKKSLDDVVASCVNSVGVEVNTASGHLLQYVSGLSARMADSIIEIRTRNGPFKSRAELKEVQGMGPKTYEQAAGFLRIRDSENPLDRSAVHPESYRIVEQMAADLSCTVTDLINDSSLRDKIRLKNYITESVGLPTLMDIVNELARPGRDPRKEFELFSFSEGVHQISDLEPGMKLPGIVTNVTAFGAFVDVGVHQDGLVHISQLSDGYVNSPASVVKVHQKVNVTVMEVDVERKRISLSMKSDPMNPEIKKEKKKERTEKKQHAGKNKSAEKKNNNRNNQPGKVLPFAGLANLLKK